MNYTYVPLPLVEEASSVSASAQVLVIDDGEVKRTDAANIGIKPTGKISISENGTNIDVSQYATADVNVSGGSSDFSTAEVTVTNNYESEIEIGDFVVLPEDDLPFNLPLSVGFAVPASETKTVYAVLYKNAAFTCSISNYVNDMIITVTGDIEDDGDGYIVVSGGGTITISKQL